MRIGVTRWIGRKMTFALFVCLAFSCVWAGHVSAGLLMDFTTAKCESPRGEVCIEIRKCPFFDNLLNKTSIPRPRSVIKIIRENQCAFFRNTPYVCCHVPTPAPQVKRENKEDREDREDREGNEGTLSVYEKLTNAVSRHKNFNLLRNDICGPIPTKSRITSGMKTALDEFPWMALIVYQTDNGFDFKCGGTVINERYVLTAAHCILNSSIVGVRLGEHNLDTTEDCDVDENYCAPPTQDFYIEDIKVHPLYNSKTFNNDIALIRLATPANFSFSNVQPVCLPTSEMDLNGKFAIVSGWGVTETGFKSSELLKVSIPVLSISACQRTYKTFAPITSNQICAGGYKGKDSCGGDSGGPMKYVGLVDGTPRFIQYGIVSYGPRHCGAEGQPGIYTRVFQYMEWILDNMKPGEDD